ncbi:MAG TPA: type II toxin-antitoxin system RelE/ParE family toxin [Opitutaceae bacterium]|jgi:mRNA interferase RelE/StbE|nr:type II toxin-antitoxin system RelE/ParE family toxin [Opitutaceae bacterium]
MKYTVTYTKQAETELLAFPVKIQRQIATKVARLQYGLAGDIKKLQATDNVYRLRSGDFRILFELEGSALVIRAIRDRKNAYE